MIKNFRTMIAGLAILFSQCASENEPGARDQALAWLTDMWVVESVHNSEDGDLTSQYDDFAIAFVKNGHDGFDGDYYVTGGGHTFPELFGKWKLHDVSRITLQNGRDMEVTIAADMLTLYFDAAAPGGRQKGLQGFFTFTLSRQQ